MPDQTEPISPACRGSALCEPAPQTVTVQDGSPFRNRFDFDPSYGYSVEELLSLSVEETAPEDFDAFWQTAHSENERIALAPIFRESAFRSQTHQIREVYFSTTGGFRIGAWLVEPRVKLYPRRIEVWGHGYGGRSCPDFDSFSEEAVQIFVCLPGFDLSVCEERVASACAALHVVTGIHSRETYILLPCIAALWSAARLMEGHYPETPIIYRGTSFGGGLGALMLPWEQRFRAAELVQPTFGFHTFRLANRSLGSAESVRRVAELAPPVRETLRYYDAVFAVRRVTVPVLAGVCAFDPAVPPPGQFAVANAIPRSLRKVSVFSFGHCDFSYEAAAAESRRHQDAFRALVEGIC